MALDFDGFSSWRCLQAHFRVLHFDVFFDSAATRNLDQLWDATWFVPGITAFWVLGCGIGGIVASRLRPRHRPSISLSSLHSFVAKGGKRRIDGESSGCLIYCWLDE